MKRSLLFLSLILCFAVVNAQNISGQKTIVNPNHVPTTFKVVNNTKTPIPTGYARVTLAAGDVWGDGSGYQMLLDANATAFGTIFQATGPLDNTGEDVAASVYAEFEYKIPTNADGALATTNIVINNSVTIDIPVGTYDYCITNPTPGSTMWIASSPLGRGDDYAFANGLSYTFTVSLNGDNDTISFSNVAGLNDIATSTFGVYPNPANDFVTITDANGANVKVIDMLGRTLISKVVKSTNETISINDLQTGMYMIQMIKDGKVSSQKLIKK